MKTIVALMSVLLLSACTGLNPKNSTMGDIGEVAWRTVLFPVTLGLSEAILKHSREEDARQEYEARAAREERRAYREWYQKLSPEDKDREDQRSARADAMLLQRAAIANQALQNMRMGGPMLQYTPPPRVFQPNQAPMPAYNPPVQRNPNVNCTSIVNGQQIYTNCQ